MFDFEKCELSDAEILSVEVVGTKLIVKYKSWDEKCRSIIFEDLVGYQWFSPEGQDLSHGTIDLEDTFLKLACQMANVGNAEEYKIFSFVSAWNDAKILRVVAVNAKQE
jgi:hypothetical protein